MPAESQDEVLFTVVGAAATLAKPVKIEDLGLTEPAHLESWVIQHPDTLGPGILIVASQYDRWVAPSGSESKDRLDVLGLDRRGHLVVGELKRGRAPDTVELQAVKYAAMTSRFTLEQLAELHARFIARTSSEGITTEGAEEKLQSHVDPDVELSQDLFARPRIVLLAESYVDSTVTSVVWLTEQGVDITLRRYKAYQTVGSETIVTVSQIYPVPDVGNWLIGPGRATKTQSLDDLPELPWSPDDFAKLLRLGFSVPIATLTACADRPGEWVPSSLAFERAGVEPKSGRGKLAGFGYSVRTTFKRSNPPWSTEWRAGGDYLSYYRVDEATAAAWLDAVGADTGSQPPDAAEEDGIVTSTGGG